MSWVNDAEVWTADNLESERQAALIATIEQQRKVAEAEGVMINGVRYAGDLGNRQTLRESVELATKRGLTTFEAWKCSDNGFHVDHPVSDVQAALSAIADRRSALIALEGQYVQQVQDGTLTDTSPLDWTTPEEETTP